MGLQSIDGILISSMYISSIFLKKPFPNSVKFWVSVFLSLTYPIIFGLLIRFERVQVQLRAQEENTIKILKTIRRSNILMAVSILTLSSSQICYSLALYGTDLFSFSPKVTYAVDIAGYALEIAFICQLSFSMFGVNQQLALFFK